MVGVNRFTAGETEPPPTFRLDPALEAQQIERIAKCAHHAAPCRGGTPAVRWSKPPAPATTPMPHILACSEAYVTVGEISDRLRTVFGEYQDRQ